jgi:hypothetical protein
MAEHGNGDHGIERNESESFDGGAGESWSHRNNLTEEEGRATAPFCI